MTDMMWDSEADSLDIVTLRRHYLSGTLTVERVAQAVLARVARRGADAVWISRVPDELVLRRARELDAQLRQEPSVFQRLPLYGIPFAVKDNIDVAAMPTTAACPAFSRMAGKTAHAVRQLLEAGAFLIGKTNMDQFATGLVGTRSPYGIPTNPFNAAYIPGGSSSGSAVAVAAGTVSFALGTDTAGSGRVPAAFNNIVGLKSTRGLISNQGVLPASRSLDCVSIFALTAADASTVLNAVSAYDTGDSYSRKKPRFPSRVNFSHKPHFRFAVPRTEDLEFFGNREAERLFHSAVDRLVEMGGEKVVTDFNPFLKAAQLLYGGPWLAERYLAIRDFIRAQPGALYPVTLEIIKKGETLTALDVFSAMHRLQAYKHQAEQVLEQVDVLVTPTCGTTYRIAEVAADPIRLNSNLGYYTNFMNLMDMSAVAVPAGFQNDGLPFGVTLSGPAFSDDALLALAHKVQRAMGLALGATSWQLPVETLSEPIIPEGHIKVAVCGAHMSGLPLNSQLTDRGGFLWRKTRTAPIYRFYALPGEGVKRPGLVRDDAGASIELEIWVLPAQEFGSFVASIPAPLGIGTLITEQGDTVQGFICEAYAVKNAVDITATGSWRIYLRND